MSTSVQILYFRTCLHALNRSLARIQNSDRLIVSLCFKLIVAFRAKAVGVLKLERCSCAGVSSTVPYDPQRQLIFNAFILRPTLTPLEGPAFTRQFCSSTTVPGPVVNKNHRQKEENRTIKIPVLLLLTSPNLYRVPRIYVPEPVAMLLFRAFVCKLLLRFNRNSHDFEK